ncbi:MAG: ABC-2 family transporter protein [Leptospiraceae bacterium]|nr:ABC-2 family transporter protein [Leptospiraceae bacterium]MDW7976699.1 ABC-2 family transporter protein [Leptospiraceae bacterium]
MFIDNTYLRLILSSIQSKMEYRGSFYVFLLSIVSFYLSQIFVIVIMIYNFRSIQGWGPGELSLLYTLFIFSYGITSNVFSGLLFFSEFIRKGDYDRILLRPLNTLGQIISMNFDLTGLIHFGLGIIALILTHHFLPIEWDLKRIFLFVLTIIGGSLIFGAIRIFVAGVSFFAIKNDSLQHLVVFSTREFILYPLNIYNRFVQFFLTFIFPIGFVNYYPAHLFLDKKEAFLHPMLIYGTFPVGVVFFLLSLLFWRVGEKHYGSTGS